MALVPGWGQDLCQAREERLSTIPISLKKKGYDLPFGAPI